MERLTTHWMDGTYDTFDPIDIVDNEYSRTNYEKVLSKLGQYEDAEEQGLLLRLPCKVGSTVYHVYSLLEKPIEFTIEKIEVYEDEIIYVDGDDNEWHECDFGKTVFFTREEAEAKLAEMQKGK